MDHTINQVLPKFLGLEEDPMGLSFTVPWDLFCQMLEQYQESFLKTSTWQNVRKKINKSKKAWNELPAE